MIRLDVRLRNLLQIVVQGGGRYSSRDIDIRYSQRHAHGAETVLESLKALETMGLVTRLVQPRSPFDRWVSTDLAEPLLDSNETSTHALASEDRG